ncbi:hypothetical protein Tco_1376801 [Tanacetum coccineum]
MPLLVPELTSGSTLDLSTVLCLALFKTNNLLPDIEKERPSCSHPLFQQDHFYDEVPERPEYVGSGTLPSNTITNPKVDLKGITTRSGVAYQGPTIPTTTSSPPKYGTIKNRVPNSEPVVIPVSAPMPNLKPSIPYPSRRNDEKRREKANDQVEKFYKIFQDMSFEISLADALILMPKFASTLKALIGNKEKLSEMARTPLNEHCSAVILNKLPENMETPANFLYHVIFPEWKSA